MVAGNVTKFSKQLYGGLYTISSSFVEILDTLLVANENFQPLSLGGEFKGEIGIYSILPVIYVLDSLNV